MQSPRRIQRASSVAAAKKIASQAQLDAADEGDAQLARALKRSVRYHKSESPLQLRSDDASSHDTPESESAASEVAETRPTKRRRNVASSTTARNKAGTAQLHETLFGAFSPEQTALPLPLPACAPPVRWHTPAYHRPLLLSGPQSRRSRAALLRWFDAASTARAMPWRKPWIDPRAGGGDLRLALERRAYEVWISEVMLQQTRVAVAAGYWEAWVARWPTVQDLAAAEPDDVLAAWRGLGYYSRARRVHEAARLVVADPGMRGLLPAEADVLERTLPGVGRYTAGAISAIVFGRAAPMVDGNVLRVLSRQLGLYANVKTDKVAVELLWAAADALVRAVARDSDELDRAFSEEEGISDRPGRWGQALMELGSTICTPKPNCSQCPITPTCRAYNEGRKLVDAAGYGLLPADRVDAVTDIEDACSLCQPFQQNDLVLDGDGYSEPSKSSKFDMKTRQQAALLPATAKPASLVSEKLTSGDVSDSRTMEVIVNHARKFPVKAVKKAVREEETLVCAIRRTDGRYLLHRRPEKGLLAGLWELPSQVLPASNDSTKVERERVAIAFATGLVPDPAGRKKQRPLKYLGELGTVPWLFSHLKLTMHVHLLMLNQAENMTKTGNPSVPSRWASSEEVEGESMATGMRKCWALVREHG